jgi:6-phosphofructokinase 1
MLTPEMTKIDSLGPAEQPSPLKLSTTFGDGVVNFIPPCSAMPFRVERRPDQEPAEDVVFEKAGPREKIYFDPARTSAAIVTCGGLCPGLNNVIRSIFYELHHHYGVENVWGIRQGYAGLDADNPWPPMRLTPEMVQDIHREGGTVLGTSRGPVDFAKAVDLLRELGVNILFTLGGDGTQKGAHQLHQEACRQGYPLAVVGVPKTIDNDIAYVWRTFGFWTAVEKAQEVIACAHAEASSAPYGVAVVKLMGRHAGFIAAAAAVASQDVNYCLVPEVPFALRGERGLLSLLRERLAERDHAVIVVAEGAGQEHLAEEPEQHDASGNLLNADIGPWLVGHIKRDLKETGKLFTVKYIDPSYIIRSVPADAEDALLCDAMGRSAVHAAMAGKTGMLIGYWYNVLIHVPIELAVSERKTMSPESELWRSVLASTGQPIRIG